MPNLRPNMIGLRLGIPSVPHHNSPKLSYPLITAQNEDAPSTKKMVATGACCSFDLCQEEV